MLRWHAYAYCLAKVVILPCERHDLTEVVCVSTTVCALQLTGSEADATAVKLAAGECFLDSSALCMKLQDQRKQRGYSTSQKVTLCMKCTCSISGEFG